MIFAGLGFTTPWLLLGLLALPILWLLLRAVPPAPRKVAFPGVSLLIGLRDDDSMSDRTPWWLLLLRMLAVAVIIIGLAGPVLNPDPQKPGQGPLVIVLDASWAAAPRWAAQMRAMQVHLDKAAREDRPVAVITLTDPQDAVLQTATQQSARVAGLRPRAWQPTPVQIDRAIASIASIDAHDTLWVSDGLDFPNRDRLIEILQSKGELTVMETGQDSIALLPVRFADGALQISAIRSKSGPERTVNVLAKGLDPSGTQRILGAVDLTFDSGDTQAEVSLSLPSELRARITRFELEQPRSAGGIILSDDSLKRREAALISGQAGREGLELLSPLHYIEQVLAPTADLLDGDLLQVLPANPDVIVLADVATLAPAETDGLIAWVEQGGTLLRFAGRRMAATDLGRGASDPLLPVRLRAGGRALGGAMSWGEAKTLAPFPDGSPFVGLTIPEDVTVSTQVVAQPDPQLANRTIAMLTDGTPLVTRKSMGSGQVVLFHVSADAEWSTLPLSGLFVQMMERLAISAPSDLRSDLQLAGTVWTPVQTLNGFGALSKAQSLAGVDGDLLASGPVGPDLQPGLYENSKQRLAVNVHNQNSALLPAKWPAQVSVIGPPTREALPLMGAALSLALILLAADVIASLALTGRLIRGAAVILLALQLTHKAEAQENDFAIDASAELVLAHVKTGVAKVDALALDGLRGLSDTLFYRTSIEPGAPMGVDLETDELAFFPLLYWPITPDQPTPSQEAYAKLNRYLRSGGMILFDTRDADISGYGSGTPNGRKLQQLAAALDIPPLEPVPTDHVLTRTFYLLQDFPGRHLGRAIWVEAAPPDAEQAEGMPFRNLNDGVTPVVIGGNDWAAAWAVDRNGLPMVPIGRGFAGERQRELAMRFGVNLVMHVLTGNYKSDQVHVPALLDRLGQ